MKYISEINFFYDWLETNPLATSCISLWYALMHIGNKAGWPDRFTVAISVLEIKTGLKRDTIYEARNKLAQSGRIKWESRRGNQSAIYELISFESIKSTQIPTQPPIQYPTQPPTQLPTITRLEETNNLVVVEEETAATENDEGLKELVKSFSNNIHAAITPIEYEKLITWQEALSKDVVIFAIEEATMQNKRTMSYLEGILKNYEKHGIKTKQQAVESKEQWVRDKQQKGANGGNTSNPSVSKSKPSFKNFKEREYDTKKLQERLVSRDKEVVTDDEIAKVMEERRKLKEKSGQ